MAFEEAEQWWEAWQLRLLVLGSLLLQWLLMVAAALRRRLTQPWFRFLTWATYQGSDALAIYALAILFNRRYKQQPSVEALWAPILLLHLGGQDGITAYSIQDSELWKRHFLIAVSQIVVAIYVFCKSWPRGDKSLLQAGILLFIPGTLKCLEKPIALWRASISSMAANVGSRACKFDNDDEDEDDQTTKLEKDISFKEFMKEAALAYANDSDAANNNKHVPADDVDHGVKDNPAHANDSDAANNNKRVPADDVDHRVKDNPYCLFVDIPYPLRIRLANLRYMSMKRDKAHRRVQSSLSKAFNRLYTNYKGYPGAVLRAVLVLLTIVAIRLFNHRHGGGAYGAADLKVTYVLLSCTAALECISAITMARCRMMSKPPWPDQVAQCNLLLYVANGRKHPKQRMLSSWLRCNRLWYCMAVPPRNSRSLIPPSPAGITELVHDHISTQWKEHIRSDTSAYRSFSNSRGQWTLDKQGCGDANKNRHLASSIRRPFDESVILWHLATEFCFLSHIDDGSKENRRCLEISNYMLYLLLTNPEMLMPGARSRILRIAYNQVNQMLGNDKEDQAQYLARKLMMKVKERRATDSTGVPSGLVDEAWELAGELMNIGDKSDGDKVVNMWKVIRGVWVEMLCFSASRCSGYLHAKSLGTGGEFLSYVWMLREYMGMQNLADMMQTPSISNSASMVQATVPNAQ